MDIYHAFFETDVDTEAPYRKDIEQAEQSNNLHAKETNVGCVVCHLVVVLFLLCPQKFINFVSNRLHF